MFDIGFSEIFIVAVVALLVLGPERLPRAARFTGLWVRRARAQWYSVKSELESELADDELKRSLASTRAELREIRDELQNHGREIREDFRREGEGIELAVKSATTSSGPAMTGAPVRGADNPGSASLDTAADNDDASAGMTGAFDLGAPPLLAQDASSADPVSAARSPTAEEPMPPEPDPAKPGLAKHDLDESAPGPWQ